VIKVSILWDEKRLSDLNSDQTVKEFESLLAEYQKEIASTSATGSIFIGLATGKDSELIKNLLNLPVEFRLKLLDYLQSKSEVNKSRVMDELNKIETEDVTQKDRLKNILLSSPHKDLEISIDRQSDIGRDIHI
jgi:hypothetical protein